MTLFYVCVTAPPCLTLDRVLTLVLTLQLHRVRALPPSHGPQESN